MIRFFGSRVAGLQPPLDSRGSSFVRREIDRPLAFALSSIFVPLPRSVSTNRAHGYLGRFHRVDVEDAGWKRDPASGVGAAERLRRRGWLDATGSAFSTAAETIVPFVLTVLRRNESRTLSAGIAASNKKP